jgi:dGTPase
MAMFERIQLEQRERTMLAKFAMCSADSAGRLHTERESERRTAFQRDRDRIIHSAAFRRLEYKTQVFVFDEGDYYRTRLTHTLEVAQIGRTLARALGANEDLVEAICLAHDLGHPPFGHAGEAALNSLMDGHGGFNHNYQSYRVVTELEERYPAWRGLNLTHETLEGLAMHETNFRLTEAAGFDAQKRGSFEAQIANITDELAYTAHDLDDGLLAGLLTLDDLRDVDIWRQVCENVGWQGGVLDEVTRHVLIRELVGLLVDDVLETTSGRLNILQPASAVDIQNQPENVVAYSATMEQMRLQLRKLLYARMYYHHRVVRMSRRAERFIGETFRALHEDSRQLPREWRARIGERGLERTLADYIASMTDRSAVQEYRRLFDPATHP